MIKATFIISGLTVEFTINGYSTCCSCGGNTGNRSLGFHVIITLPYVSIAFCISALACSGFSSGNLGSALLAANSILW